MNTIKIKITNAGHWSNNNGRAIPVIMISPANAGDFPTLAAAAAAAFTFGGDRRQRGRAVRRARRTT